MTLTESDRENFVREGYFHARGLLPPDRVAAIKGELLAALEIDEADPRTWRDKPVTVDDARAIAATEPGRSDAFEAVVEQLVGPDFVRGVCYSPFLEWRHKPPVIRAGFIPVIKYPEEDSGSWQPGRDGWHIDGGASIRAWPGVNFLAVMAYLSDTPAHGGATVVWPGSHRQVFERWLATDCAGAPGVPDDLPVRDPVLVSARAGDVLFMHYLLVHAGSPNRAPHLRVGINTAVLPHPARPYQRKTGPPSADWTPLDHTLRTDRL